MNLRTGQHTAQLLAFVDTGAGHCMFERAIGVMLGLEIEAGEPKGFLTVTGRVQTFGHLLEIEVMDIRFESMVYFFEDFEIRKNLLGRTGWLDRIRLGLVDHDQMLYIAPYDLEPGSESNARLR